jgi:hypothetical protein
MPGSGFNPTIPSSIQLGEQRPGDSRESSVQAIAAPGGRPFLWPHLVTWHRLDPQPNGYSSWDGVATHPTFAPGGYDSLDTKAMDALDAIMAGAGMDPLASFWGAQTPAGDRFMEPYLARQAPVKVGVLFEVGDCIENPILRFDSKCLVPFDGTLGAENAQIFRDRIAHLHERYFSNPKYGDRILRVGGLPVVFVWLTNGFTGDFKSVCRAVKAEFPVYLVGANLNLYNPPQGSELERTLGGLDAISAYGIADSNFAPDGAIDAEYAARWEQAMQSWSQWMKKNMKHALLIPPLLFAYDDTNVPGRHNRVFRSDPEGARILMETAYAFIEGSQRACGNVAPGVVVVSLNEDFEGSSTYPTLEYGDTYYKLLQEFSKRQLSPRECN